MRTMLVTCLMLVLATAWAWRMPADAQVVLTAQDGRIVGVGFALAGERFDLELLAGFEGAAQLLVVSLADGALALRAIVADGVVYVDTASFDGAGHDGDAEPLEPVALTDLLDASGFAHVAVGAPGVDRAVPAAAGADRVRGAGAAEAATGTVPSDDADAGDPDARAADRAHEASDRADESARDRADEDHGEDGSGPPADDERPVPTPLNRP